MSPVPKKSTGAIGRAIIYGWLCLSATALAGPPFITDDPEPVELHHWEIYIGSQMQYDPSENAGTLPHLEVNYGPIRNVQLHVIAPLAFDYPSCGPAIMGYGDTELGVKFRFLQETAGRPMVGVFPLAQAPTGSSARGLGSGEWQFFLPVWLQKGWGSWTGNAGGGYFINPGTGNKNYWLAGWLLQKDLSEHLTLGGELFATTAQTDGIDSEYNFNLGGQINLNEHNYILFSGGHNFRGISTWMSYLAWQWTFGG